MTFGFQVFDRDGNGGFVASDPLHLELNDAGKAIKTFEMDILACRMAAELLSSRAGLGMDDIRLDDESGSIVTSGFDCSLPHEVFDDCLDLCEYVLNRLTPHSDKAIKNLMVHCRFTLAHILGIIPSDDSHIKCSKGKSRNLAAFSHVKGERDEFRHISHIRYCSEAYDELGDAKYSYADLEELLGLHGICTRYYRTILADVTGRESSLLVRVPPKTYLSSDVMTVDGVPMMPLLSIISEMTELHSMITPLRFHDERDALDMGNNRVCEDEALLGRVRVRRPDMESSPLSIKDTYLRNREVSGHVMVFARILECVISGSSIKRKVVQLSFRDESVLRMLDPDMFGKRYVTPMLIFVDSERLMRSYMTLIDSLATAFNATYTIGSEAADMARCLWKYSGRQNVALRKEGVMCSIVPPKFSTAYDLLRLRHSGNDGDRHHESMLFDKKLVTSPVILVSDREGCFKLASGLSDPSRKNHMRMVRMLVEVDEDFCGHTAIFTRNRDSNEVPQALVSDIVGLFELHTEGVLPKAKSAAKRVIAELDCEGLSDRERTVVDLIRRCCVTVLEDVGKVERIIRGGGQ